MATTTSPINSKALTPFTYEHFVQAIQTFKDDMLMCYIDEAVGIYCKLRGVSVGTRPPSNKDYSTEYAVAFEAANYAIYLVSTKIGSFNQLEGDFKPYLGKALKNALKDILKADNKGDFFDQTAHKKNKDDEPEIHNRVNVSSYGDTDDESKSDPDNIEKDREERIRRHQDDALEVMIKYIDGLPMIKREAIYASAFGQALRPDIEGYGRNYADIIAEMYNTTAAYVRKIAAEGKREALAEARRQGFNETSMGEITIGFLVVKNEDTGMHDKVLKAISELKPEQQFMLLRHLANTISCSSINTKNMALWSGMVHRSMARDERKEDINIPGIHNTHHFENEHVFTDDQLSLIEDILSKGDEYFHACPQESEEYSLKKKLYEEIPVYLIPYETYLVEIKKRCMSPFAIKMRGLYQNEIDRIPQNCNPEERERIMRRINTKYGPWLLPSGCSGSCKGCTAIAGTPLGYFVPDEDGGKIYICLDRIIEEYPKKKWDSIAAKVLLHELGHAIMFNLEHWEYETCFEYWAEESLANKIALNYLAVASNALGRPDLIDHATEMVKKQKAPYRFGLYLHEHNASDWASLRDSKNNINEVFADQWVDSACDLLNYPSAVKFAELQRLFFRALDGNVMAASTSGFETWVYSPAAGHLSTHYAKKYLASVTSPYIGLVFKEMVGWGYDTIADCKSSWEIQKLIDRIGKNGSEQIDRDFNTATSGVVHRSLILYQQYLLSLGL